MPHATNPDDTADLLTGNGFTFTDAPESAAPNTASMQSDDDDLEFRPRQRTRMHWLTTLLIGRAIWGAGFLTDRTLTSGG